MGEKQGWVPLYVGSRFMRLPGRWWCGVCRREESRLCPKRGPRQLGEWNHVAEMEESREGRLGWGGGGRGFVCGPVQPATPLWFTGGAAGEAAPPQAWRPRRKLEALIPTPVVGKFAES